MSDGIAEALSALATKDDLLLTKNDLRHEIEGVRHEIEGVRHEIGGVDARVSVVMWAVGVNVAMTIAILGVLLHH